MPDQCPYLEYRPLSDAGNPRPYCTVDEEFVQPMRADVCTDRYDLDHETDCEIYRDHEGLPGVSDESDAVADAEDR